MRRDIQAPVGEKVRAAVEADSDLKAFLGATPAQIETWIDNNVSTMAHVRRVLKLVLKVLLYLVRKSK